MRSIEEKRYSAKKVTRKIFSLLSNLKFAIVILLIIAGFSIFGTVIEQNQTLDFYKENYPDNKLVFGLLNWQIIKFFNLNDIYKSWWYLSLLILLGLSLIVCSFTSQLPMLKVSKQWKFLIFKQELKNIDIKIKIKNINFSKIVSALNKKTYNIFQQKNSLFCYKGVVGRIAPVVVHISIIQIFIGAFLGAFFGYGGQEMIPKTETFHLQNIVDAGYLSVTPVKTALRVNNFWIDYTKKENGTINQFYSDVSLINNKGEEIRRKIISVNNPLHYKDLTLYQSDWDIIGVRQQKMGENSKLEYEAKKIKTSNGNRWLSQVKVTEKKKEKVNILIKDLQEKISLYDDEGNFLDKVKEGELFGVGNNKFLIKEILTATGIDIKSDPGIPFVYLGFVLLITSTLLSFTSYSRIWVLKIKESFYIGGTSNRAKISFERYFLNEVNNVLKE